MSIQASWNTALGTLGVLGHLAEQGKMEAYRGSTEILNRAQDELNPVVDENMRVLRENILGGVAETNWEDEASMDRYGETVASVAKEEADKLTEAKQQFNERLNVQNMPKQVRKLYEQGMSAWSAQAQHRVNKAFDEATNEGYEIISRRNERAAAAQAAQEHATNNDGPVNRGSDVTSRLEQVMHTRRQRPDIQFDFTGGND